LTKFLKGRRKTGRKEEEEGEGEEGEEGKESTHL
jgi:hypothetical protein